MDPDKCLEDIRESISLFRDKKERGDPWEFTTPIAEEIVDMVQDLDEWLTKGGFIPQDWYHPENYE